MTSGESLDLSGKTAIVTGSTVGLGRAIIERLAAGGARVVVNARHADKVQEAATELRGLGHDVLGIAADVSDPVAVNHLVDTTIEHFGAVDVLVNNAGIPYVVPSEEADPETFARVIATNLTGPFLCASACAAKSMLERRSGVVVNVSSIFGQTAVPYRAAYVAAKHGLDGLTKTLAIEWADRGVRVVSVNPAYLDTAFMRATLASGKYRLEDVLGRTPVGRLGTCEEVADVVAYLASDHCSYLTGASIPIDGGWLANGGW